MHNLVELCWYCLQDVVRRYKESHPGNWDLLPERVAFQVRLGAQLLAPPLDSLFTVICVCTCKLRGTGSVELEPETEAAFCVSLTLAAVMCCTCVCVFVRMHS
jgi:hypothetical protein